MRFGARLALLVLAAAGCASEKPTPPSPPSLAVVSMRDGKLQAPDTLPAGTIRFRLARADSVGHNLVVFALGGNAVAEDFARSLDLATETPVPATARGGAEAPPAAGDTAEVYITLEPGRYLLGCMVRGFASTRHVAAGEWQLLTVIPASAEAPPAATIELGLADFAFQAEERWPAGDQIIRVSNIGTQEHIVLFARIEPGHTVQQWIAAAGDAPWSHDLGGVSRLGPGRTVLLPLRLEPGRYILTCLFVDPKSGRPHVELGMLREIVVGQRS